MTQLTEDIDDIRNLSVKIGEVRDLMDQGFNDPAKIAVMTGYSESSVRRWMEIISIVQGK